MADLSIVLDPGGVPGGRPGINLPVYPSGQEPIRWSSLGPDIQRLSNANLSAGGFSELMEFGWTATLEEADYNKLKALIVAIQQTKSQLKQWEVVIYNLTEPFVELGLARSRFRVPGTTIDTIDMGNGWLQYSYYLALQGSLSITPRRVGAYYVCDFEFVEGLKLTKEIEDSL